MILHGGCQASGSAIIRQLVQGNSARDLVKAWINLEGDGVWREPELVARVKAR
jgi:hypothetical protein